MWENKFSQFFDIVDEMNVVEMEREAFLTISQESTTRRVVEYF